ncbi:MAG: hypothetical protein ACE5D8_10195 [Fidelibacterota bacterium]
MAESMQPDETQDSQKQFLIGKFGELLEKIGDGYGKPLQEELVRRLEKTIADFHVEVEELLAELKERSVKRHEDLKRLWEQGHQEESAVETDSEDQEPEDMSDWERRLEEKATGSSTPASEEETPKKRGFFHKKKS